MTQYAKRPPGRRAVVRNIGRDEDDMDMIPAPADLKDYWARRCQALCQSPVIAYLQSREDRAGSGRVLDPREAA